MTPPPQDPQQPPQSSPTRRFRAGYPLQQSPQWPPDEPDHDPSDTYPPPPAAPAAMGTRKLLVIIGALLVGLASIGGAIASAVNVTSSTSSSRSLSDQTRANNPQYDPPTPSGIDPTTPAAPTPTQGTPKPAPAVAAALAWYNGGGNNHMTTLATESTVRELAVRDSKSVGLRWVCNLLQQHVQEAQAYAPYPDSEGQRWWAAALALFAQSVTDCLTGVDTNNADLLTRSWTEMTEGVQNIDKLSARLKELSG
jgi:hypothetical protein